MATTEKQVTKQVLSQLEKWLIHEHGVKGALSWPEKVALDDTRADGLVVGMFEDGDTYTVSVEAKSLKTMHQLVAKYRASGHLGESAGLAALVALLNPVAGLFAGAANLLFRKSAHTGHDAADQSAGYPGDYRILAIPSDVFMAAPEIEDELSAYCEKLGIGLLCVEDGCDLDWVVGPERFDDEDDFDEDEEWLDQYKIGQELREEVAKFLSVELGEIRK